MQALHWTNHSYRVCTWWRYFHKYFTLVICRWGALGWVDLRNQFVGRVLDDSRGHPLVIWETFSELVRYWMSCDCYLRLIDHLMWSHKLKLRCCLIVYVDSWWIVFCLHECKFGIFSIAHVVVGVVVFVDQLVRYVLHHCQVCIHSSRLKLGLISSIDLVLMDLISAWHVL